MRGKNALFSHLKLRLLCHGVVAEIDGLCFRFSRVATP